MNALLAASLLQTENNAGINVQVKSGINDGQCSTGGAADS